MGRCYGSLPEELDTTQELLIQVRDFLRDHDVPFLGPYWYHRFTWVLELEGKSPNNGHEATWIEVDLDEYMEITIAVRSSDKTSRMDFSLYEADCFERLADAARNAALGKF